MQIYNLIFNYQKNKQPLNEIHPIHDKAINWASFLPTLKSYNYTL